MPSPLYLDVEEQDRAFVLAEFPDVRFAEGHLTGDALVQACADAEVISLFVTTRFSAEILAKLPNLKLLCTRTVGFDHIDLDACQKQNITVCHVPDYGAHVIAEHVFALLLSAARRIEEGRVRVREQGFEYRGLRGMALKGKTLGIVGTGRIGRNVAHIARGFGMRLIATDVYENADLQREYELQYLPLTELLAESDVVTLHAPAMKETTHLLGEEEFKRMKKGAILVNTARGALVDEAAMLRALDSEHLAYALLDVAEQEAGGPRNDALINHPKVTLTPHVAFYTEESVRAMYADCAQSIREWMAGEAPRHKVAVKA